MTACDFTNDQYEFESYIADDEEYSVMTLPSGQSFVSADLDRDKDKYYTILQINVPDESVPWGLLSEDEQKNDLQYAAKILIDYAKSASWDNNYYLYVKIHNAGLDFVYDYETDTLYYSKRLGQIKLMYEDFGTADPKELIGNLDGEKFLVANQMAETKHEVTEINYSTFLSYNVFINDGCFVDYGLEYSTAY